MGPTQKLQAVLLALYDDTALAAAAAAATCTTNLLAPPAANMVTKNQTTALRSAPGAGRGPPALPVGRISYS
jgi:hypothetical protein